MRKWYILGWLIILTFCGPIMAQSKIKLYRLGGQAGWIHAEANIGATAGYGLGADLGTPIPGLHWHNSLDFWTKRYRQSDFARERWTHWELTSQAKYYFRPVTKALSPFLGAGLGLNLNHLQTDYGNTVPDSSLKDASDTKIKLTFSAITGLELAFTPNVAGFIQAAYHLNGIDFASVQLGFWIRLRADKSRSKADNK